ncbi:helix-turn-helix domain-containing protein [Deinococcus alpinitundrae]|uniref:helix-turn-helix domain-containing protein n=1 Tax=Deinococcus alpinitundrae TaxID=468913 RepID=UPI00137B244D|nr:helix-turn-helix transcriptional regulator [Deinococcus alpinitundrae]
MSEESSFKAAVEIALAKKGITVDDLSTRMGTHKNMLIRLINEEHSINPSPLLPRLLEALDIEIEIIYRVK